MNYQQLLEKVHDHVIAYYKEHDTKNLIYHNLKHTQDVVAAATQIANHYQLNDDDFFIVLAAVWFHDLGYLTDLNAHEDKGAELAAAFLEKHGVNAEYVDLVKGCIKATKMPQSPSTLLEEIVCDADLFHLGTDSFPDLNKRMRKEAEWRFDKKISKHEWRKGTLQLLETHHFHTDYARNLLQAKKDQNVEKLKQKDAHRRNRRCAYFYILNMRRC